MLVWVFGFYIGKKVLFRLNNPNFKAMLLYAILSGILMFFVGILDFIFKYLDYGFDITFYDYIYHIESIYIESIESKTMFLGTFCSFLLGELWENKRRKLK